ncbi:MAG: hypothetical protein IPM54_12815 [Polyangiaceae bacterium]|nr:hypothetical protein [Polyangiaceae bacterium]
MSNPTPEVVGSQKAYEQYLSEAEALADADVRPFRADGSLALHNVEMGLDAISPHVDRIKAELPTVDVVALQKLPDLALAVIYAAAQVDRTSDGSTGALIDKARASRTLLLASAEALAVAGILPAHEVERIRSGTGPIDLAQDNVDLAALLTKHATAIAGKTAVTPEQVTEAAHVGTELLKRLKPKGTRSKDPAIEAVALRDRFWTLLAMRHKELRRVGMWLWMDEVDRFVPALQSRTVRRKKPENG